MHTKGNKICPIKRFENVQTLFKSATVKGNVNELKSIELP